MKRATSLQIRRGGILQLSTWLILAGSTISLTSCDSSERKARESRASYEAESKRLIDELDSQRQQLLSGEVPNNFHIPNVGYYHAGAKDFYEHSYNSQKDGKWFVNNAWVDQPGPETVPPSRPAPESLTRIQSTLEKAEQSLDATAAQANQYAHQASSGPGLGSAMMMYWLLSGNRGGFTPSAGFSNFGQRAPLWESKYRQQREQQARSGSSGGGAASGYRRSGTSGGSSGDDGSSASRRSTSPSSGSSAGAGSTARPSSGSSAPSSRGGFGSSGGSSSS